MREGYSGIFKKIVLGVGLLASHGEMAQANEPPPKAAEVVKSVKETKDVVNMKALLDEFKGYADHMNRRKLANRNAVELYNQIGELEDHEEKNKTEIAKLKSQYDAITKELDSGSAEAQMAEQRIKEALKQRAVWDKSPEANQLYLYIAAIEPEELSGTSILREIYQRDPALSQRLFQMMTEDRKDSPQYMLKKVIVNYFLDSKTVDLRTPIILNSSQIPGWAKDLAIDSLVAEIKENNLTKPSTNENFVGPATIVLNGIEQARAEELKLKYPALKNIPLTQNK